MYFKIIFNCDKRSRGKWLKTKLSFDVTLSITATARTSLRFYRPLRFNGNAYLIINSL